MSVVRLCFEDWRVEIAWSDADGLRWLAGFLEAGFRDDPASDPADARVEVSVDAEAYARLVAAAPATPVLALGFAGDGKDARFELRSEQGGLRVYRHPKRPLLFLVSPDLRRVRILAREPFPKLRRAVMRVVRELAMARVASSGGVVLHASALHRAEGVVALAGPRRSGKTTLLGALLRAGDARYVANDRCVLRLEGDRATIRGLPTLVSIRTPEGGSQPSLEPPEFCARMGVSAAPEGPLAALVFPRVTRERERWTLRRLSPAEALPRLRAGLFRADRERALGEVFVSTQEPAHRLAARALCAPLERRLVARVPCFECRLGGGRLPEARHARALLEALHPVEARREQEVMRV